MIGEVSVKAVRRTGEEKNTNKTVFYGSSTH